MDDIKVIITLVLACPAVPGKHFILAGRTCADIYVIKNLFEGA